MTTLGQYFREKPANVVPYTTLEFYHPDFGTLRYVFNQYSALTATLESGAPRDASAAVTFEPIGGHAADPEQGQFGASVEVQLGLAGAELKEKMNAITDTGRLTPIEGIWRRYLSDDLSTPAAVFYMQVASVNMKGRQGAIMLQQRSPMQRSTWRVYKDDEFPGTATNA